MRGKSQGPVRQGWLLTPPRVGVGFDIVDESSERIRTSPVQRMLATSDHDLFVQTRNSTYCVTALNEHEREWLHRGHTAACIGGSQFGQEETGAKWQTRAPEQEEVN